MVFRLNATICGAVMTLAFSSVAMAQNDIDAVHSNAVVIAVSGAAITESHCVPGVDHGMLPLVPISRSSCLLRPQ